MRDGILHPEKWDPDAIVRRRRAHDGDERRPASEIYEYFGNLVDERTEAAGRRHPHALRRRPRSTARSSTRDEILDICFLFLIAGLDTVSDTLTCFYAFLAQHPEHRQMIVDDPSIIPIAVEELLRWESPVPSGVPRHRHAVPSSCRAARTSTTGTAVMANYGAANVDPADVRRSVRRALRPRAETRTSRSAAACTAASARTSPRRELRVTLREWHRRIPEYWIKPGHEELEYPPGLRHVKDLTLTWK